MCKWLPQAQSAIIFLSNMEMDVVMVHFTLCCTIIRLARNRVQATHTHAVYVP